jgi:hypothetical protein
VAQDMDKWRERDVIMNLHVPQNAGNFLTGEGSFGFRRRTLFHGVRDLP